MGTARNTCTVPALAVQRVEAAAGLRVDQVLARGCFLLTSTPGATPPSPRPKFCEVSLDLNPTDDGCSSSFARPPRLRCLFVGAPLYWLANQFAESPATTSSKLWWAFGAFVFGFYVQIHAGHYVFEKRKPALMDGFAEAMLSAPLFVWLEVIFFFGFRKDLRETVERKARVLIASYEKAS